MTSSLPSMLDAVLFDLDGTIWDSLPGITASLAHALEEMDLVVPDDATLASNVGPPLRVMLGEFGIAEDRLDEAVAVYRRRYRTHGEFECTVFPGAVELLDELRGRGVRLATATSKGVEPTKRMLGHFGLADRFDVVAAAAMDGRSHRKIDVIADALSGLGHLPGPTDHAEVVMVGDRHYDIDGGRHFGMRTIGVSWGYGPDGELESAKATAVVGSFAELGALLAQWGDVGDQRR